jgi:hypothetical protein
MTARRPGFFYRAIASSVLLFLLFALSVTVFAQDSQQVTRWQAFAGYSYMRFDSQSIGFANQSNLNGADVSGVFNITRRFGVFADASANFGNEIKLYNFTIGPQLAFRQKNSTFFVRGLFGKNRDQVSANGGKTSIGKVYGAGAGYDWHYSSRFDIRVLQVDYLNGNSYGKTQKNVRVSAGLVFHFGGK